MTSDDEITQEVYGITTSVESDSCDEEDTQVKYSVSHAEA